MRQTKFEKKSVKFRALNSFKKYAHKITAKSQVIQEKPKEQGLPLLVKDTRRKIY